MKNLVTFTLLMSFSFISLSQSRFGIVEDETGNALFGVTVINETRKTGVTTNIDGQFEIKARNGELLKFSYIGKKTKYYKLQPKDSVLLIIQLEEDLTQLNEFVVDGKRIKKVSAQKNENIIDYYSLGVNTFLILKSVNRNYVISLEGNNKVYKTFTNIENKPTGLFYDFRDKFYLKYKDSVKQFDFSTNLTIIDSMSVKDFENKIVPILHYNDSSIIKYSFLNHNKSYYISKIDKYKTHLLYQYSDSVGIKNANQNYNEAVSLYMKTTEPTDNIITNKNWNGEIKNLSISLSNPRDQRDYRRVMKLRKNLFQSVSYYDKFSSKEVEITSFYVNKAIFSFNYNNDSLIVQNINGDILQQKKLTIPNKGFTKKVVLDREQHTFYAYSLNDGVVTLDKLNLQSGKTTDSYELKGVTFPKKLKVIDGWAYFINPNKNGFHKLYRIELR